MEWMDRYLNEVSKRLPKKNREDILAEIRSYLEDKLDERTGGKPTEEDVLALLKEAGSPKKMAASYAPEGQYVIGPALFPLFRMVTGIALAATIGAQLLAWGISFWTQAEGFNPVELIGSLLTSVPTTIGMVVIVFMILQAYGVKPDLEDKWDPRELPAIENSQEISRGESIFGIIAGSILMAILVVMPDRIAIYGLPGGEIFPNPVIRQVLPWLLASLAVSIGFEIYKLWRGRWNVATRAVELGVDVFSIVVLAMLYKGHAVWLEAQGVSSTIFNLTNMADEITTNAQLFGMKAFTLAFAIALIVVTVVTISKLVRMILASVRGDQTGKKLA